MASRVLDDRGAGVDAAERHLGLGVAFGAGGDQPPAIELLTKPVEGLVGHLAEGGGAGRWISARLVGEALGQDLGEDGLGLGLGAVALALAQHFGGVDARQQVEGDRLALAPVGRGLEDGRAGQAAMG